MQTIRKLTTTDNEFDVFKTIQHASYLTSLDDMHGYLLFVLSSKKC